MVFEHEANFDSSQDVAFETPTALTKHSPARDGISSSEKRAFLDYIAKNMRNAKEEEKQP
jgi:hypothetical protein